MKTYSKRNSSRRGPRAAQKVRRSLTPASPVGRETVQYTVRNVPAKVDRALRRKAVEEKKSLNEILRQALIKEAGEGGLQARVYHDLDHLIGTWVEDPDFDAAIADQDKVDESLWK